MKYFYKKISKKIFFYWLEKDFNKNLDLLEKFKLQEKLKKEVKKSITRSKKINIDTGYIEYADSMDSIIDWICSMVISMYCEYDYIPSDMGSLDKEAKFITQSFINAYKNGKIKKDIDIISYLCIPNRPIFNKGNIDINNNDIKLKIDEYKQMDYFDRIDSLFKKLSEIYDAKYKKRFRPGLKHYALGLWYITYQCVLDVKNFSREYNINYIDDGEQRCFFNVLNLYIHKVLFTGKLLQPEEDRRVIFAASAIHPAQDDYIDKQEVDKSIINDIYLKIEGKEVVAKDKNVKIIFDLIDIIYKKYPVEKHENLVEILKKLHYWQLKSTKQKLKNCDEDELLNISLMKGGYAFAFYGYIALGKMDFLEFRHFFGMGGIFQIMDDLHDIEIDINDNIETIWTKHIYNNTKADEVINGIIEIQREFESITGPFKSLKRPVFLRRMELFAVRLDLFKFYLQNNKYFSEYILEDFKNLLTPNLEEYIDKYKNNMNNLKTMEEFQVILLAIKDSYIRQFKQSLR